MMCWCVYTQLDKRWHINANNWLPCNGLNVWRRRYSQVGLRRWWPPLSLRRLPFMWIHSTQNTPWHINTNMFPHQWMNGLPHQGQPYVWIEPLKMATPPSQTNDESTTLTPPPPNFFLIYAMGFSSSCFPFQYILYSMFPIHKQVTCPFHYSFLFLKVLRP